MKNTTVFRRRRARRNTGWSWSTGLRVTANGSGVVAHAGASAIRLLADRSGLTDALSVAMGGTKNGRGYDRGRVLADAAVAMADGLDTIRRMGLLSDQGGVFDEMASRSTVQRVFGDEIDTDRLAAITTARARVRAHMWSLIEARHGRIPAAKIPGGDLGEQIVLRVDANFVDAYSYKQGAGKLHGRFGYHPMNVYCDNTGEALVNRLRAGDTAPNDADHHIEVLTEAIFTQLPESHRHNLLITTDGAGASHDVVNWLHALNRRPTSRDPGRTVEYSIGWTLDRSTGPVIYALGDQAWTPMLTDNGVPGTPATLDAPSGPDTVGEITEITHLLPRLRHWPPGLRVIARRVKPLRDVTPDVLPGLARQLELDGIADAAAHAVTGWRYEVFATNSKHPNIAWLDARHRKHARVEDRIRCGKHLGAAKYPFWDYLANTAWLTLHSIAADLLTWTQLIGCDHPLATAEPRTFQDRILHAPAALTRGSRQQQLNFPPHWPWTHHIVTIFERIQNLPTLQPLPRPG